MGLVVNFAPVMYFILICNGNDWNDLTEDDVNCGNTREVGRNTYCYKNRDDDDLPATKIFKRPSIFFIQTVCKRGLNYREACSVESAARANPHRVVNILFAGPVSSNCLFQEPFLSLATYDNIEPYRINVTTFTEGTNLEGLINSPEFQASSHQPLDAANILKFAALYKYGGIYLDFDMIVMKSFDRLSRVKNWIGKTSPTTLGTAVLALSRDGIGRRIAYKVGSILSEDFGDDSWTSECASDIMKIALESICNTTDVRNMTHSTCKGFRVYPPAYFYPIPVRSWKMLFRNFTRLDSYNMYAIHTWNHFSADVRIPTQSLMAVLMKKYCPVVFEKYNGPNIKKVVVVSKD